jgi:hypothetical protein
MPGEGVVWRHKVLPIKRLLVLTLPAKCHFLMAGWREGATKDDTATRLGRRDC